MIWDKLAKIWRGEQEVVVEKPFSRLDLIEEDEQEPEFQEAAQKAFQASPVELGDSAVRQAALDKYKLILPYLMEQPQFPHCNQYILHAPSTCTYCDAHSDWQMERISKKVEFTGAKVIRNDWIECPADAIFQVSAKNKWPGNQPEKPPGPLDLKSIKATIEADKKDKYIPKAFSPLIKKY